MRRIVFISHANPQDNDFTRWLGMQLGNAGYEIWSDVIKLIGGELFWDDIEDAIRNHSAKVVVAVSKSAIGKAGVLDEIAVAIGVERSQKIANFVVPLRLDDIDFNDFRANLTRKNVIDFSGGWAPGLAQLLKVLERDAVPTGNVSAADVNEWCRNRYDTGQLPRMEEETLISNWLRVPALPEKVSIFSLEVPTKEVPAVMASTNLPWFPYFRLVGIFGSEVDLRLSLPPELPIKLEYEVPIDVFLKGYSTHLPGMKPGEARNHVSSLLRQAWNRTMKSRGLASFEMASKSTVWFFQKDLIEDNKANFVDETGKVRKRNVVGRSDVRNVYWHLGFQARPSVRHETRLVMRPAILFSEDGKTPLSDVAKMHRLRRSFCRNWWNPHWRDLLRAYVAWLTDEVGNIDIELGEVSRLQVPSRLVEFISPVAVSDPVVKSTAEAVQSEEDEETPPEAPPDSDDDGYDSEDELSGDSDE